MDSITSLREEHSLVRREVFALQREHRVIGQRLEEKRAELRVIEKWLNNPPDFLAPPRRSDLPSATEAVDDLVAKVPGLRRRDVLDRLEGTVNSDSDNVRTIISSAISRRVKSGDIVQTEDKKLFPKGHESLAPPPEDEPEDDDDEDGLPF